MNWEPLDQFLWDATLALKVSILKVYPSYTDTQQESSIVSAHTFNEKARVPFKNIQKKYGDIFLKYANKLLWEVTAPYFTHSRPREQKRFQSEKWLWFYQF